MEVVQRGVHIMVATPGRLMDMLDKKMVGFFKLYAISRVVLRYYVPHAPPNIRDIACIALRGGTQRRASSRTRAKKCLFSHETFVTCLTCGQTE